MRGCIPVFSTVLTTLGLICAAPITRAAPADPDTPARSVALTSVTTHGVDKAAVPGFAKSLLGGLAAGGLKVIGLDKVTEALQPHAGLAGCETAVCLRKVGVLLKVPLTGKATVEQSGTTTFRIEVVLTASATGKQVSRLERRCELCTLKEAREALSRAAADAAKKAATEPGIEPPRSKLRRPPPKRRIPPRRLVPTKPRMKLVDQGRAWRRWGLVTAGVGVAALIPGIVLVAIHGKDTGSGPPTEDRYRWNTMAGGAALMAIGATAVVAGTVMLVYGILRKRVPVPMVGAFYDPKTKRGMITGSFRF